MNCRIFNMYKQKYVFVFYQEDLLNVCNLFKKSSYKITVRVENKVCAFKRKKNLKPMIYLFP